jgi:hypothetical protein
MNTRKYPRSTVEAFGCRGDAACAVERPRPYPRTLWVTMGMAVVYLAGLLLWEVL